MATFLLWLATCIALYVMGAVTWPKLKLHFIHLRADPLGAIKADMAKLQAAKDRMLGHKNDPPMGGAI